MNSLISLVVTTNGIRQSEIERLFISLNNQTYLNFEIILVQQNQKYFPLEELLQKYNLESKTSVIKTPTIPLSNARNIGLKKVKGNIVCFPDDDCWYEIDLLKKVNELFNSPKSSDVLCFNVYDPIKKTHYGKSRKVKMLKIKVNSFNSYTFPISVGIFIRPKFLEDISFDESIGLGTTIGSGEETDLIHKLISIGYMVEFYSQVYVFHEVNNEINFNRIKKYSLGYGYTVKKGVKTHKLYFLLIPFFSFLMKHFLATILFTFLFEKKLALKYFYRFYYSLKGFFKLAGRI